MLPGLESRIAGLDIGAEREGVIPAAEAYGTAESLPTKVIPRGDFAHDVPVAGKVYEAKSATGEPIKFTVVSVRDEEVLVRFDHPLAGKDIRFKVKILNVTKP
jgi:FKBP-type peptidyl-prolyl cis-trans isomerase 2